MMITQRPFERGRVIAGMKMFWMSNPEGNLFFHTRFEKVMNSRIRELFQKILSQVSRCARLIRHLSILKAAGDC